MIERVVSEQVASRFLLGMGMNGREQGDLNIYRPQPRRLCSLVA